MILEERVTAAATQLVEISEWVDRGNAGRDPEALLWIRVAKAAEEAGEAISALNAMTGANPRKEASHTDEHVVAELLDTAVAALGAIEHITGHHRLALPMLIDKIGRVHGRALGGPRRYL